MSRVAKAPIKIVDKVSVELKDSQVLVKGPKGQLSLDVVPEVSLNITDNVLELSSSAVESRKGARFAKSIVATFSRLLANMVTGVSVGFNKNLNLVGVGYRAAVKAGNLELNLGFSHPISVKLPEGIEVKVEANTKIVVSATDKQKLGQFVAEIKKLRPPEPYKGKGVICEGEVIFRKEAKKKKS